MIRWPLQSSLANDPEQEIAGATNRKKWTHVADRTVKPLRQLQQAHRNVAVRAMYCSTGPTSQFSNLRRQVDQATRSASHCRSRWESVRGNLEFGLPEHPVTQDLEADVVGFVAEPSLVPFFLTCLDIEWLSE